MRLITLKIPAATAVEVAQVGDYVRVKSAAVDLTIEQTDSGELIEVGQGDDFQFTPFQRLRISHASGSEQTVKLIVSSGKKAGSAQVGGSVTVSNAVALDAATLAALESITVQNAVALDAATLAALESITVQNAVALDAATLAALESISVQNLPAQQGAFTQQRASITNVNSGILPANAARRYLLVQNNDAAAVLRVTLDATAASPTVGVRVPPGASIEFQGYVCSGGVNVCMETASATPSNVEYVSG